MLACALLAAPAPALADCAYGPAFPAYGQARGETFTGTFRGKTTDEFGQDVLHWDVDHVYAGDIETGRLDGWGAGRPNCHGLHFRVGARYLVSARDGHRDAFGTLAYRVHTGGSVSLVPFQGTAAGFPTRYRVYSLVDAVAYLAPGALPATEAIRGPGRAGDGHLQLLLLALAFTLGMGAWMVGVRHRALGS
jgi:hypothetical protein